MLFVCEEGKCTACRSCEQICPVDCISLIKNAHETTAAIYNKEKCISCNLCKNACPQISKRNGLYPIKCYAAWSTNEEIRINSASGGIATEIYRYYASINGLFTGVSIDNELYARYKLSKSLDDINLFQNSKYVESDTGEVFSQIELALKNNNTIVFIGLPCHVAGLKSYLGTNGISTEGLTTVDIVCHGTTPVIFLIDHVNHIAARKKRCLSDISFRDPHEGTHTFTFTLSDSKGTYYKKKVDRDDVYQIGYHQGLTYRDNCYSCIFACPQRQGDLTISDFSGLGKEAPCDYSGYSVSCVLVNSEKGMELFNSIMSRGYVHADKVLILSLRNYSSVAANPV